MQLDSTLQQLAAFCAARGVAAWLVGGAARDLALGRAPTDLDLAVDGDGLELARAFADTAGGAFVALDPPRRTGRAVLPGPSPLVVDFAGLRAATIAGDLRLRDFTVNALALPLEETPRWGVSTGATGAVAVAAPLPFLDPTGGLADLRAGRLRLAGPESLVDDPLRVLRAARFVATLGLRPDPALPAAMAAAAPGLGGVAAERARDELLKLLDAPAAAPALRLLAGCGALTTLIPELQPAADYGPPGMVYRTILEHLLESVAALDWLVVSVRSAAPSSPASLPAGEGWHDGAGARDALPAAVRALPDLQAELPYAERLDALLGERRAGGHRRAALLKLAALLHDIAKPQTAEAHPDGSVSFYGHQDLGAEVALRIARRLKLSRADAAYVGLVIREHMRPGQLRTSEVITLRAVARFFRDLGDAGPDVLLHELADHLATRGHTATQRGWTAHLAFVEAMLRQLYTPPPERVAPLLNGNELMAELEIGPGPQLGALLREIAEAQAAGEISTREEALALARRMHAERQ